MLGEVFGVNRSRIQFFIFVNVHLLSFSDIAVTLAVFQAYEHLSDHHVALFPHQIFIIKYRHHQESAALHSNPLLHIAPSLWQAVCGLVLVQFLVQTFDVPLAHETA